MKWAWPKLKQELQNLSSSLKLQMHLEAPNHAPCTETTIDLAIAEHDRLLADLAKHKWALQYATEVVSRRYDSDADAKERCRLAREFILNLPVTSPVTENAVR